MKISLIGYMGSGKSTIARKLGDVLNLGVIDLDDYIEEKEGRSISQIFEEDGEPMFRIKERKHLQRLLASDFTGIISLGGGTPCFFTNMNDINNHTISVYLNVPEDTLAYRLERERDKRPKISHLNPEDLKLFVSNHLKDRQPFYNRAKHVLQANQSLEDVIHKLLKLLN